MPPLLDAFVDAYAALSRSAARAGQGDDRRYGAFVAAEREPICKAHARAPARRAYWQDQWREPLPVLELPTDRPRATRWPRGRPDALRRVASDRSERVRRVLRGPHGVSAAALFLGVYEQLLLTIATAARPNLMVGVPDARPAATSASASRSATSPNLVALRSRRRPQ